MLDDADLSRTDLDLDVVLHYADRQGAASKRTITLKRVYVDGDIHFDAYCHLRKGPRTFLGRNMIDVADGVTGEILDPVKFTARLLGVQDEAVSSRLKVKRKTRPRTTDFEITFGADDMAVGWTFGVHSAFRAALDIGMTQYKGGMKEWTRGAPPQLSFGVGDTFYDPPQAHRMIWGEALKVLSRSVKITAARSDIVRYGNGWEIDSGEVTFTLTPYENGNPSASASHTLSQSDFVEFLKTGMPPKAAEEKFADLITV